MVLTNEGQARLREERHDPSPLEQEAARPLPSFQGVASNVLLVVARSVARQWLVVSAQQKNQ